MKVIIIGGVAGASCAARLRRLDENAEIIMVERGPYGIGITTPVSVCWRTNNRVIRLLIRKELA